MRAAPAIGRDLTRHLLVHGHAMIEGVWSRKTARRLAREAAALFAHRQVTSGSIGPPQQATASDAPVLASLQFALLPMARALTGQLLVPSCGWYNFYPTDDAIRLHTDVEESDLVLLASVLGEPGPLHLHPELQGRVQSELDAIQNDPGWNPAGGVAVPYPPLGILALRGRKVPHHRAGSPCSSLTAVIALHYKTLW